MNPATMTLEQVRFTGLQALSRDLGPAGLVRFLQQFEMGSGDYTTERRGWLGDRTVRDFAEEIERQGKTATPECLARLPTLAGVGFNQQGVDAYPQKHASMRARSGHGI